MFNKRIKIICCSIGITLLLLLLVPLHVFRAEIVTGDTPCLTISHQFSHQSIDSWYSTDDNVYHFFLPAYAQKFQQVNIGHKTYSVDEPIFADGKTFMIHKSSNLTAVFIDTASENNEYIMADKLNKESGTIRTVGANGNVSFSSELEYITGRGNSTWNYEKKPFTIKFKQSYSLCGMSPQKKWVLLTNVYEGTKVSYKMMLDYAAYIGLEYTPECTWVDLYLNGQYQGNYLLCQAIDINSGTLDIKDGILIEKEHPLYYENEPHGFVINDSHHFVVKSPSIISTDEISELSDYFYNLDYMLRQGNREYNSYLDINSVAKNHIVDELSCKSDTCITSTFFYKQKNDDMLYMGPVWDFDGSFGESKGKWTDPSRSVVDGKSYGFLDWYRLLYNSDEKYLSYLTSIYTNSLPYLNYLIEEGIDSYAEYISDSIAMDMIRWNYSDCSAGYYTSHGNNIRYLKYFLSERLKFFSGQLGVPYDKQFDFTNGQTHTVTVIADDTVTEIAMPDGAFITNLPDVADKNWKYRHNKSPVTEYIPVYEDVTVKLY